MRSINPRLFASLMRLPEHARADLLEYIGATPVEESDLCAVIDSFAKGSAAERGPVTAEAR